jgi:hypothetical protein
MLYETRPCALRSLGCALPLFLRWLRRSDGDDSRLFLERMLARQFVEASHLVTPGRTVRKPQSEQRVVDNLASAPAT